MCGRPPVARPTPPPLEEDGMVSMLSQESVKASDSQRNLCVFWESPGNFGSATKSI